MKILSNGGAAETDARSRLGISGFAFFVGFGFYWAWVVIAFYSDSVMPSVAGGAALIELFWSFSTPIHAATLIVCALGALYFRARITRAPALWISGIGVSSGLVLTSFGSLGAAAPSPVVVFAAVLVGVFSAFQFVAWGELYSTMPVRDMPIVSLMAFIFGLLVYFVFADFSVHIVSTIALIAIPLLSALCATFCRTCEPTERTARPQTDETAKPWDSIVLIVALFAFALCGETLRGLTVHISLSSTNDMGAIYLLGGMLGIFALAAYCLAPIGKNSPRGVNMRVMRTSLIVMAVAFLLVPVFSSTSIALSYGFFGAGFWCVRVVSWIYCFLFIRRFEANPVRVVAVLDAAFALSVLASWPLNSAIASFVQHDSAAIVIVSLAIALVLMFIVTFVLYNRQATTVFNVYEETVPLEPEASAPSPSGDLDERMAALASTFGLTARETDVVRLMAQGRSLPFIQEELCISAGTAQTHSRHIYRKMGIHARQELIDIFEQGISEK